MLAVVRVLQVSTLWVRLILVPFSFAIVVCTGVYGISGLLQILVVLIFVGGLLVLLVSVAAISFQDQGAISGVLVFFCVFGFGGFIAREVSVNEPIAGAWWAIPWLEGSIIMLSLVFLVLSLVLVLVT